MIEFKISAPGKIILFGEHAVVYGKTAVASSLGLRTTVHFTELAGSEEFIKIYFPKISLSAVVPLQEIRNHFFVNSNIKSMDSFETLHEQVQGFVRNIGYWNLQQKLSLEAFFNLLMYILLKEEFNIVPFQIHLVTELPVGSGLGSSASFAVCLAASFLHWSHLQKDIYRSFEPRDLDKISKYALCCEKIMHGAPSGIDNSVCTYGSIIEFKKGSHLKQLHNISNIRVLLVDTRVGRSTKMLMEKLLDLKHKYPVIVDLILESIDNISIEALKILKSLPSANEETRLNAHKQLMILINMNQGLLSTCQVSHPSLDRICAEAQNYGLAAKLTGAGGGGHAYILLLPDTQPETISSISRKLMADGFSVTLTTLGGAGVEIDQ